MKKTTFYLFLLFVTICICMWFLVITIRIDKKEISNDEGFSISFLDIGQGDATLINFTNGEQMLIDCAIDARIIEALGRVMDFHDKYIDYLVVTHPDADHYGGCIDVLNRFTVGTIIINGLEKSGDFFQEYSKVIETEDADIITIEAEEVWEIASTTLHWLYPDHTIAEDSNIPGQEKETNANDTSIAVKVSYNGVNILMTGDAEEAEELYLIDTYGDLLDIDILKAGHHESNTSSILPFIETTSPDHVIFSAGEENNFGHPSLRVIRRVERAGAEVWRTDREGDILLDIGDKEFWLNKEQFYVDK